MGNNRRTQRVNATIAVCFLLVVTICAIVAVRAIAAPVSGDSALIGAQSVGTSTLEALGLPQ